MKIADAAAHCRAHAAPEGSDLYYATLHLPPAPRAALCALHLCADEIWKIPRRVSDPGVARIKLLWWHDALSTLARGNVIAHPALITLGDFLSARAPPPLAGHLSALAASWMQACEHILNREIFTDLTASETLARATHGTLAQAGALLVGNDSTATAHHAEHIGTALGLHALLRGAHQDAQQNIFLLPRMEADPLAGMPHTFAAAAERIHTLISAAGNPHSGARYCRIQAAMCLRLLAREQGGGFCYLQRQLHLTPIRKLWIAVTTR